MYMCLTCGQVFHLHSSLVIHMTFDHSDPAGYIYYAKARKANRQTNGVKIYIPEDILATFGASPGDYYILRREDSENGCPAYVLYFAKNPPTGRTE